MARYTVTKNYAEIAEKYGVLQNLTGDANIEITNDISQAGIILKPFKTLMFSQKIYARKVGNVGTSVLAVMPYKKLWEDPDAVPPKRCDDESTEEESSDVTFDEYGDLFLRKQKSNAPPLEVQETSTHYVVTVSKDSLQGQNKFILQFDDKKKG